MKGKSLIRRIEHLEEVATPRETVVPILKQIEAHIRADLENKEPAGPPLSDLLGELRRIQEINTGK